MLSYEHLYQTLRVDPDNIRLDSICKGATTYCCAVVHTKPPIVSVCLQADWTGGRVKELYLNMTTLEMSLLVSH